MDIYDAKTGAKRQSRQLLTDGGPPPYLLDVQGDLVVYATGGAIHLLRLSDGRDKALRLPGAAHCIDAHLEPAGLFVSWNQMYAPRQGRIAFIPLRAIAGACRRMGAIAEVIMQASIAWARLHWGRDGDSRGAAARTASRCRRRGI